MQDCGYFTRSSPPVGRLPEPIDFRKLVNQAEYRLVLDRLHNQLGVSQLLPSCTTPPSRPYSSRVAGSHAQPATHTAMSTMCIQQDISRHVCMLQVDWVTPSEIFRPWWGQGVAKYILETRQHVWKSSEPLQIVEIGGGAGSLAASVLVSYQNNSSSGSSVRRCGWLCSSQEPEGVRAAPVPCKVVRNDCTGVGLQVEHSLHICTFAS
jgi:hypothetical protein